MVSVSVSILFLRYFSADIWVLLLHWQCLFLLAFGLGFSLDVDRFCLKLGFGFTFERSLIGPSLGIKKWF